MSDIDWSKAPEGTTHANPRPAICDWYKIDEFVWCWDRGICGWTGTVMRSDFLFNHLIQRPRAWSGEGLPPAGIDIEVKHASYGWIGARVVGADGEAAIVRTNDGYAGVFPHEFRPIRTAEQIAAEEREIAVSEIIRTIGWSDSMPGSYDAAGRLYDAGFRKVEVKP